MYSNKVIEQLKIDEGFSATPYKDSMGFNTIGYGWCIDRTPCDKELGELILNHFSKKIWDELVYKAPWVVSQPQVVQDVLLNMSYNLGVSGLLRFYIFIRYIQGGRYKEAADDLEHTLWHKQVGKRAVRLEDQLRSI